MLDFYFFLDQGNGPERLVSGSDDFTLYLWQPNEDKKPITRMTGHQQLINDVRFSPDTRLIASASFDKSCKLWDGRNGKYVFLIDGVQCGNAVILKIKERKWF